MERLGSLAVEIMALTLGVAASATAGSLSTNVVRAPRDGVPTMVLLGWAVPNATVDGGRAMETHVAGIAMWGHEYFSGARKADAEGNGSTHLEAHSPKCLAGPQTDTAWTGTVLRDGDRSAVRSRAMKGCAIPVS